MVTGKALAHTAVSTVVVNSCSKLTLIVRMVSQPVAAPRSAESRVGKVYTCPSKAYGNWFAHTSILTVVVCSGKVVKLIVRIVSQPLAEETVSVTDPTPLNT